MTCEKCGKSQMDVQTVITRDPQLIFNLCVACWRDLNEIIYEYNHKVKFILLDWVKTKP